jgi:GTP cyclohydrolase-4
MGSMKGSRQPDVQSHQVPDSYRLTRVGVKGVRKPVRVRRPGRTVTLQPVISLFVDLPARQRGSHMSRNIEVVSELVERSVKSPCSSLEELAAKLSRGLLDKHEYATQAEVEMRADYFVEKKNPSGKKSTEHYLLIGRALAHRGATILVRKSIGVEVVGMTACPCAQETVKEYLAKTDKRLLDGTCPPPMLTHNQRNLTSLMIEVPERFSVEADDLINLVEGSQSSPTYEILKRPDEGQVVLNAHRNPKFVEDVVRDLLRKVVESYPDLPDEVAVSVRSESQESIHKHDAVAERITTMGELRRSRPAFEFPKKSCA